MQSIQVFGFNPSKNYVDFAHKYNQNQTLGSWNRTRSAGSGNYIDRYLCL